MKAEEGINEKLKSGRNVNSNLSTASYFYRASASRPPLQQYLFVFGFLLAFFCFDSARVRPHKATGEPQEYNAKVYSAYLELQAVPGQAIDAAAWTRRGASYPFPGSLPRPALLILLTWIFTSHKPIFGRGQAFCVAT